MTGYDDRYKINRRTGCWDWQMAKNSGGYGVVREIGRFFYAHRVLYEENKGPIPDGLTIDHLCRNRACVNPNHLEPVTQKENNRRGRVARKRKRSLKRPAGAVR